MSISCAASISLGKRTHELHGSSSGNRGDNRGHRSNKRDRVDANGGGDALFDLNVPAELVDKI
jgi:ariadne-1